MSNKKKKVRNFTDKEKVQRLKRIFKDISNGDTLRKALRTEGMGSETFFRWIDEDKESDLSKHYMRACELRAEAMAEDLLSIADSTEDDVIIDENGKEITNWNNINRDRLRVEARKWLMSKMFPTKYSEKTNIKLDADVKTDITIDWSTDE